jgi:ATP-dependent exoDNAse (exonuclease V) beta subunit
MAPKGESKESPLSPCTSGTPHPLSPSSLAAKKSLPKSKEHEVEGHGEGTCSLDAADIGTEIHEVLSRIEWDTSVVDLSTISEKARELLEAFFMSEEAKSVFTKPGENYELWNEKPFDLMIDGQWISGIFDRVQIRREGGRPVKADILDYKTNQKTPEAIKEEYEGQMEQYRVAASKLLGINLDWVSARTVPIRVA